MKIPVRYDYAYPLRISAVHHQAERATYSDHVDQMIRQFLLTSPGERVCKPFFGGGLRSLIFAPLAPNLKSATELMILNGLQTYLGQQITVAGVTVNAPSDLGDTTVEIVVKYVLIDTQTTQSTTVQFS